MPFHKQIKTSVTLNDNIDNTKLVGIIRSLDKPARLAGRRFLESPYFNNSHELVIIYMEILKLLEKDKAVGKLHIWKKIEKEAPFNDLRFRKYCSDLSKLMEQFLAQLAYDEDTLQQKIFLLRGLNKRAQKADKLVKGIERVIKETAEAYPYRGSDFFLFQYLSQKEVYEIKDYGIQRSIEDNVEAMSTYLDLFYFGDKLRLILAAESRKKVKVHDSQIALLDDIIALVDKNKATLELSPQVKIYTQIYKMATSEQGDDYFYELKRLIAENALFFPREVAVGEFYNAAQNYCIKKMNAGQSAFVQELFDIFKMLIDQDLLISNDMITPWYFRNIVVVALRLGQYQWTEAFIENHQDYLPSDLRDNAVSFNLAQLYFYQKKYSAVIEQLQHVEYDDLSYNLNGKIMLLLTYYETDEIDALYSFTDAFRTYLTRQRKAKKLPKSKADDYLHLIRFVRALVKIFPGDKAALAKLKAEVQATKGVVNANWLLEKIAEMEG